MTYDEDLAKTVFTTALREGKSTKDAAKLAWQGAKDFAKAHQSLRIEDNELVA